MEIKLSKSVKSRITVDELLFVSNYLNDAHGLTGFDCLNILELSTNDCDENKTMTNQKFDVNFFYTPNLNKKVTVKTYRAKSWNCSNTCHEITEIVEL